jgi:hypothetical protein
LNNETKTSPPGVPTPPETIDISEPSLLTAADHLRRLLKYWQQLSVEPSALVLTLLLPPLSEP